MRIVSIAIATALAGASLTGCRVSGEGWLAVYGSGMSAEEQVTFAFQATCATGSDQRPVLVTFNDPVAGIDIEGEVPADVCLMVDPRTEAYGTYRGRYYVVADTLGVAEGESGLFYFQIVDRGELGYSLRDFICLSIESGPFADYELPIERDLDDDGAKDPGCAYIGDGRIRLDVFYPPKDAV